MTQLEWRTQLAQFKSQNLNHKTRIIKIESQKSARKRQMSEKLGKLLQPENLLALAGRQSYDRGQHYFQNGAVRSIEICGEEIIARVSSNQIYEARLGIYRNQLWGQCSCPYGREGAFCKHLVATALRWIADPSPSTGSAPHLPGMVSDSEIHETLRNCDREILLQLMWDWSKTDVRWREHLRRFAATQRPNFDLSPFRVTLREAIGIDVDHHDTRYGYNARYGYDDGYGVGWDPDGAIAVLDDLNLAIGQGHADAVRELLEDAAEWLECSCEYIDDSNGEMGNVAELLIQYHRHACKLGNPDQIELAQWLFFTQYESNYGLFDNLIPGYIDYLDQSGRSEYRRLAEQKTAQNTADSWRGRVARQILESFLHLTADLDEQIAVITQDLSNPSRYTQVVDLCRQHDRMDQGLHWAEESLKTFGFDHGNSRNLTFVLDRYQAMGRIGEAIALARSQFQERPSTIAYNQVYKLLDSDAKQQAWYTEAIVHLQTQISKSISPDVSPHESWQSYPAYPDHFLDVLLKIALQANDLDCAWATAREHTEQLRPHQWLTLAEHSEIVRPADALSVYTPHVESSIQQKNSRGYADAVRYLMRCKSLMERLDRSTEFATWLNTLRFTHKRKRNFIKLLNSSVSLT
jgi:uncharacterized Zn finger protein